MFTGSLPRNLLWFWCLIGWSSYNSIWYFASFDRFATNQLDEFRLENPTVQRPESAAFSTPTLKEQAPLPSLFKPQEVNNATSHRVEDSTLVLQSYTNGTDHIPKEEYLVTAMIIEIRCNPALSLILKQAAAMLGPEFRIVVYHSPDNEAFVRGLIESDPNLRQMLHRMDDGNTTTSTGTQRLAMQQVHPTDYGIENGLFAYSGKFWYSRMLTNQTFWESITTPYALTLQADTLLCRPFPTHEFISKNESFLGGLSGFKRKSTERVPVTAAPKENTTITIRHLNGGLSLRNVPWVIRCIQEFNDMAQPQGWVEDSLYRYCQEKEIDGTVHINEAQAYSFASDNGMTMCFNSTTTPNGKLQQRTCPVGVHKPWALGGRRWGQRAYRELVQSCPGLDLLERLCSKKDNMTKDAIRGDWCHAYDIDGSYLSFECHCA